MSEELLIRHCSPTLAGIKTGNLFTSTYSSEEEVVEMVREYNRTLGPKGLRILPMCYRKGRVLIYVYRPQKLKEDLEDISACRVLERKGYPCESSERCVVKLAGRLREKEEFPHEIGLFLGYPPEDVKGFMENKNEGCKCTGFWKVYGDEEKARKLFAKYQKCINIYYSQWSLGKSVERLTVCCPSRTS